MYCADVWNENFESAHKSQIQVKMVSFWEKALGNLVRNCPTATLNIVEFEAAIAPSTL